MGKKGIAGKTQSIRFPQWMADAIDEIVEQRKSTFTDVVLELLRLELKPMGYSMGIGREVENTGKEKMTKQTTKKAG